MRGTKWLFSGLLVVALATLAGAQALRVIHLQYADARLVAGTLGGLVAGAPASSDNPERFARDAIAQGHQQLRRADNSWMPFMQARSYPQEGQGLRHLLPPGLTQPPVALPEQNALLVRGPEEALDQLREIIALIDRPTPMINIDLRMVDEPRERVEEWGFDFWALGQEIGIGSGGNVPAGGVQLRWGVGRVGVGAGWDQRTAQGRSATGANVTTFNAVPATVTFGEVLPFFAAHVTRDIWGNRQVSYEPYSVFAGIELWVEPRITAEDTVTMRLRPTIIDAVGAVTAPDGSGVPVTKNVLTETQVRVRDGESMVIGGFNRLLDSQTQRVSGLLSDKKITRSSNPTLIVTPRIIREVPRR
jgi:type II secretory pathway component GspD/PulD (secretin)